MPSRCTARQRGEAFGERAGQGREPLAIGQIRAVAVVPQVEGDIIGLLGDGHHVLTQDVRDAGFIEHVGVLASEVAHDDRRSKDQREDVLDDNAVVPHVVGTLTGQLDLRGGRADRGVDAVEARVEGHHHRDQCRVRIDVGDLEHRRGHVNPASPPVRA